MRFGGCVYLRLLQIKNQLAEFDRYFDADTRDGLKLTFTLDAATGRVRRMKGNSMGMNIDMDFGEPPASAASAASQ